MSGKQAKKERKENPNAFKGNPQPSQFDLGKSILATQNNVTVLMNILVEAVRLISYYCPKCGNETEVKQVPGVIKDGKQTTEAHVYCSKCDQLLWVLNEKSPHIQLQQQQI